MPFVDDKGLRNKRNKKAEEVTIEGDIREMLKHKSSVKQMINHTQIKRDSKSSFQTTSVLHLKKPEGEVEIDEGYMSCGSSSDEGP